MARRKPQQLELGAVPALGNARCPRGHVSVRLSTGRDQVGKYLRAWCTEPGCGADHTFHDPGRDV